MKVSVVIPAYNEEKYIRTCLESILKQTEKPDEIIVVDNNSTDSTVAIVQEYPVRLIHEHIQGLTHARNKGYNEAQYEIIARTDADSIVSANWVKIIKKYIQDDEVVAISGPCYFYDAPLAVLVTRIQLFIFFSVAKVFVHHGLLQGPNHALKKIYWNKIKNEVCMNDKEVHEDMDLSIHLSRFGKIKYISELRVNISARRITNDFKSIATDYLKRWIRTMFYQKHLTS
jgi:glycosyltransferase involved in cell wall biosynthesis